jgi:hypothetical protein
MWSWLDARIEMPSSSVVGSLGDYNRYRVRDNAGSVGPSTDPMAGKARHYGRFSNPVLWRGVMCENTSGKPRVSGARGAREPSD